MFTMNSIRRIAILAAVLLVLAGPAFAWKFASMADSRGSTNGVNVTTLSTIVTRINAENVDMVIFQGDAVSGSSSDATLSSQMDTWLVEMNKLNPPWYYTPGNHEIQTSTAEANVLRAKVDQPLNGPLGHEEMVFSFDYQNAHFVFLNSNHYGEAHHVQRAWLTDDLAHNTQPHVFVMAHEPAYPAGPHVGSSLDVYPTERDDFWSIMTDADVRMYFCGHEHLYQRSQHGSITQVLNGSCGAPLYTGVPNTQAVYHYVIVTVDGNWVHCDARDDAGNLIDSWDYAVGPSPTVSSLKEASDNTPVYVTGKTVTAGNNVFNATFYIEDEDRSSGIKVYGSPTTVSAGDGVDVFGTLSSQYSERAILNPSVYPRTATYTVDPLGMISRSVGGGSLNANTPGITGGIGTHNTGLLVTIWGEVTFVNDLSGYFYVDDGYGRLDGTGYTGVRVDCSQRISGLSLPDQYTHVVVTGVCSRKKTGTTYFPIVRPRTQDDIVPYP
jgi:hypothetical protein